MDNSSSDKRLLITGGGSGGHVTPLIAVIRALRKRNPEIDIRYIGADGFSEELLGKENIEVDTIAAGKLRRYFSFENFFDVFKVGIGMVQALWKLYWYMPDVVFSKGGFGSVPVIFAAAFYRIPVIVHESDVAAGLATRMTSRFAKVAALAFAEAAGTFPKSQTVVTGNPVRSTLLIDKPTQAEAKRYFGFHENTPLLLVLGGSQGSQRLNDFIVELLPELIGRYQIIHQVGEKNLESISADAEILLESSAPEQKFRYQPYGFLNEEKYKMAISGADIVISRAGSGAIFELAAFEKPSILVPLKGSAQDHQRLNAVAYYDAGCCLYFEEDNMLPHLFVEQLNSLLENDERLAAMRDACRLFAKPQAADAVAEQILQLLSL